MRAFVVIFFTLSLLSSFSGQAKLSYEKCKECENADFTKKITDTYHVGEHVGQCIIESDTGSALSSEAVEVLQDLYLDLPAECVLASNKNLDDASTKGTNKFRICNEDRSNLYQRDKRLAPNCKKRTYVQKVCSNPSYVELTQGVLNKTAECVGIHAKELFAIFNHESRMIINNRSPSGALCYGQLTAATVETLNGYDTLNYDYYASREKGAPSEFEMNQLRISNVLQRCPEIAEQFNRLETKRKTVQDKNGDDVEIVVYKDYNSHCEVVENPYTCMLYSALYHQSNVFFARKQLSQAKVWRSTNQKQGKQIIHMDTKTRKAFETRMAERPEWNYLEYEEQGVFANEKHIQEVLTWFTYNGGPRVIKTLFRDYVYEMRGRLDNSNNKELREEFFNGGISTQRFMEEFGELIKKEYRWGGPARKKEVSEYAQKLIDDAGKIENKQPSLALQCLDSDSYVYSVISERVGE